MIPNQHANPAVLDLAVVYSSGQATQLADHFHSDWDCLATPVELGCRRELELRILLNLLLDEGKVDMAVRYLPCRGIHQARLLRCCSTCI